MARARERAAQRRPHAPTLSVLRRYGLIVALTVLIAGAMLMSERQQDAGPARTATAGLRVIDGDTLIYRNERIRLSGIDAPELSQTCRDGKAREWSCGQAAKARLDALLSQGDVTCSARGKDRYGRVLAVCAAGSVTDIGAALVRDGLALNYDRYTGDYAGAQHEARAAQRGLWQGEFVAPEAWRRQHAKGGTPTS